MIGDAVLSGFELPARLIAKMTDGEFKAKTVKPSDVSEEIKLIIEKKIL